MKINLLVVFRYYVSAVGFYFPNAVRFVYVSDAFGLHRLVQIENNFLRDGSLEALIENVYRSCVPDDFLMVLDGFAGNGKPLLQHKMGITQGKSIP